MRKKVMKSGGLRRRAGWMGAVGAALCAALTVVAAPAPASEAGQYVALGDSFAAGPGLQPQVAGQPYGCGRSQVNYPRLTAASVGAALIDVTCSGATVNSVRATQLSALSAATTTVSLTVGANDLRCGMWCAPLPSAVGSLVADIHARAPHARLFLVGYGTYLPVNGCPPVPPAYANGLRASIATANAALQGQASAHSGTYVDIAAASTAHTACTPEGTRWFEPGVSQSDAAPWHPTHTGMTGIADVLSTAMRSAA